MVRFILLFSLFQNPPQDTIPLVDSNVILDKSYDLFSESEYDSAIYYLEQVHEEDTNFHKVSYKLLSCFVYTEQTEKAEKLASSIRQRKLLESSFYLEYGNAFTNTEQFEKGIEVYLEGLEAFPYNHYLMYNIGYAKSRQRKYEEALEYLQMALKIQPFYSPAHQILGNLCADLGFRTKALLSYATYLAINPDRNWALVKMNNLANDAYREEGSLDPGGLDNSTFERYDNLSKSRAAMDDRFQSEVDFEAPVAQQLELLLKKLALEEDSDDFWMNFYVPTFVKLESEGLSTDFIYFLLSSTGNEEVNDYLEKNEKNKNAWFEIINTSFVQYRQYQQRTVGGITGTFEHWYRDDNSLSAIGNEKDGKNTGPWVYYYENGFKNAEGVFADHGDKKGTWHYYHENGEISSIETHDDTGLVQGEIVRYSEEGVRLSVTTYKDDSLHGSWTAYYPCGDTKEIYPYVDGKGQGEGMTFYIGGNVETRYNIVDGLLEGEYITYFHDGSVYKRVNYVNDKKEGEYRSYHFGGMEYEKGSYIGDLATGVWEYYFSNGNPSSSGEYREGKKIGEWTYFNHSGTRSTKENYNEEGVLDGSSYMYDPSGRMFSERIYQNGVLIAYNFLNPAGEVIHEQDSPTGEFEDYRFYYASGQLKSKGTLREGMLNGPYTSYHPSGIVSQKGTMKDDQWDGLYEEFDEAGNLTYRYFNEGGDVEGYYRIFYPTGQVKEEGWFVDGKSQQTWMEYWMDGTIKSESYYVDGDLQGWVKEYGPKGKLFEKQFYVDGRQMKIIQYDTLGNSFHQLDVEDSTQASTTKYADGSTYFASGYECGQIADDINFYYPDGSVQSAYQIVNSTYQGPYKGYDLFGRIALEGQYENDSQVGKWTYYFDNGQESAVYHYAGGQLQGPSLDYYENGIVSSEDFFLDDELQGKRVQYGPSGQIALIKYYIKGIGPVSYRYELADGSLSDSIPIAMNGDFELKSFYSNGSVSAIQRYKDFNFDGELDYYDEEGNLLRKSPYKKGNQHGVRTHYHSNGKVQMKRPYYFGEEHGEEIRYYHNGQIKESQEYLFGVKNGWNRFYREDGTLIREVYYWNNKIYTE